MSPTIVEREPVTVVGLQTRFEGDDSVVRALWEAFGARWDEFDGLATTAASYGVVTDFTPEPMAFDYLVGVPTAGTDDLPDDLSGDLVAVDVPGGTYARFESTLASFEADYEAVTTTWLAGSGYERRVAPEYERYGPEFDPDDPASRYEYYLPVRPSPA